jgi:conjugative transfer signal peptidase TraF
MSQPVLIMTLALGVSVALTEAIAIATLASQAFGRAIRLAGLVAIIGFALVTLWRAHVQINFTGSMPLGIYTLTPLSHDGMRRGMLVAACAPSRAARKGRQRGYLGSGPCVDDTERLLKFVVAISGDRIDVTPAGVTINGCPLPSSRPAPRDRSGRPLAPWPFGRYRLGPHELWLYAEDDRSWDSRYWGPTSVTDIEAEVNPLLAFSRPYVARRATALKRTRCSFDSPTLAHCNVLRWFCY